MEVQTSKASKQPGPVLFHLRSSLTLHGVMVYLTFMMDGCVLHATSHDPGGQPAHKKNINLMADCETPPLIYN